MKTLYINLSSALMDIEAEMHRIELWAEQSLPEEAFASEQPFCLDTMDFPQWIQFVFLPRMHSLLESEAPLPGSCQVAPMAEMYFAEKRMDCQVLLKLLAQVDELLNAPR